MNSWRDKANRIIAEDCFKAWKAANTPRRAKHRPYSPSSQAVALVECLTMNDEIRAKAIFLHRAEFGATEWIGA